MKSNRSSILGFMIIIVLFFSNSALADSGLSYTVKPGDNGTYQIIKDYSQGQNLPILYQQSFQDGSKINVSIQEGLIFTITICYIIGSGVNATIYTRVTINARTSSCTFSDVVRPGYLQNNQFYIPLISFLSPQTLPVIPITDNLSYFQNIAPQKTFIPNFPYSNDYITTYTLRNNNLLIKTIGNISRCFIGTCTPESSINVNIDTEINANIQTGWYRNVSATESFDNGTIFTQYIVTQNTTTTSGGLPGFEISSTLLAVFTAVPIVLIKRKRK